MNNMRSRRGLLAASAFLLLVPVALLNQILLGVDAETTVHFVAALGFALLAVAVFDFQTPRWATWAASIAASLSAATYLLQGVSNVVPNEALRYVAFQVLGQQLERVLPDVLILWFLTLALTDSRGWTKGLGLTVVSIAVAVELLGYVGSIYESVPVLKAVLLLPFVWFAVESAQKPASVMNSSAQWPRRILLRTARGFGGLVGLLVLLTVAGFAYQTVALAQDRDAFPPSGQLVDVGGHQLHIQCTGTGSPTVVAESGFAGTSLDWSLVQPAVGETTRICTYDRAGFGWSDAGPAPRTSGRIVDELHTLLANAGIPGPYVVVGHSVGGLHALLFASRYPAEVAGVVLLDPTPAAYLASLEPAAQLEAAPPSAQLRMIQVMQPIGLTRLLGLRGPIPVQNLSADQLRQVNAVSFRPTVGDALFEEGSAWQVDLDEALDAAPLRADMPLIVLTRALVVGPPEQDAAGKEANSDLASRSTHGQVVVAERSGHYIQLDRPDLVIDAINQTVHSVR